jgi:hypothetical protein
MHFHLGKATITTTFKMVETCREVNVSIFWNQLICVNN